MPPAWAAKGWRLWQYAGNETEADAAYGSEPRAVAGVSHCDRNLFAGDAPALYRFWKARRRNRVSRRHSSRRGCFICALARSIASAIRRCASSTSPQPMQLHPFAGLEILVVHEEVLDLLAA